LSADFLVASLADELSELKAAQKRAEEAEAAVKRQKQLGRRLQMAALVAVVLAIASGGLAMWAIGARNESRARARIATSRRLAAVSMSERQKRFDLSLLLAVEARRAEDTFEARNALLEAVQARPGLRSMLKVKEGSVDSVAFSPDGETIAAGYGVRVGDFGDGGVVLFDAAARRRLSEQPLAVKEGDVHSVAFSPGGKTIAAGYGVGYGGVGSVGGLVLWDVDPSSWQGLAGTIANRNFTRAEWRQYFPEEQEHYRPTFPDLPVPPEDAASKSAR
jgi:hypothetical protein